MTVEDILRKRIHDAIDAGDRWGNIDGDHHRAWVITKMLKILMEPGQYKHFIETRKENDQPWYEGIAP